MSAVKSGLSAWDVPHAIHQPTQVLQRRGDQIGRSSLPGPGWREKPTQGEIAYNEFDR